MIELPYVYYPPKQNFLVSNENLFGKKSKTVMTELEQLFPKIDFKNCDCLGNLPELFEEGLCDNKLDFHRFKLKHKYKKRPYENVNVTLSLLPYGEDYHLFSISTKPDGGYLWQRLYSIELTGEKIQAIINSLGAETYFPSLKCCGLFQKQDEIKGAKSAHTDIIRAIIKNYLWMDLKQDTRNCHELLKITGESDFYSFGTSQAEYENFGKMDTQNLFKPRLKYHYGEKIMENFDSGPIGRFYFYLLPKTRDNLDCTPKSGLNPSNFQDEYKPITSLILKEFPFQYAPRI